MALGKTVKRLREEAGLTQTQLADLAGMDQQALAALENRDSKSSQFIAALAGALGKPISELLGFATEDDVGQRAAIVAGAEREVASLFARANSALSKLTLKDMRVQVNQLERIAGLNNARRGDSDEVPNKNS